ncbi:cytotoxin [Patescibacteria group bacterium]|nr:cytotoxin [Patescibacteria group bacterium]
MIINYSSKFTNQYKELIKTNKKLTLKIDKKIDFFINNPYHPSLRMRTVNTIKAGVAFSFWIEGDLRIIFTYVGKNEVLFLLIGNHKEVYR